MNKLRGTHIMNDTGRTGLTFSAMVKSELPNGKVVDMFSMYKVLDEAFKTEYNRQVSDNIIEPIVEMTVITKEGNMTFKDDMLHLDSVNEFVDSVEEGIG